MLWAASQAAGDFFRKFQERSVEQGIPIAENVELFMDAYNKEKFLLEKFKAPLTDLGVEKLIQKRAKQKPISPPPNNVFQLRT